MKNADILDAAGDEDGMVVASRLHQAFCAWFSSLTRWRVFKPRYAPFLHLGMPEIQDLLVVPEFRRNGVGQHLRVMQRSDEENLHGVILGATSR